MTMTSMYVPAPVISLAIVPKDNKAQMAMSKALNRFTKEDPTFKTHVDPETNETIIEGMGELHLDVYVERMKREYNAEVTTGNPRVAYRETITQRADFTYTHKKQTGGAGQYGRIAGYIEPVTEEEFVFDNQIFGGAIPTQYIPACEKGFKESMAKGPKLEFPITGVKVVINDGAAHSVDSSDMAFQIAGAMALRKAVIEAGPVLLEPIMDVEVSIPEEFLGAISGDINSRRGRIMGMEVKGKEQVVKAQVPLSEMFKYANDLRSITAGRGFYIMHFSHYEKVPHKVSAPIIAHYQSNKKQKE